MSRFNPVSWKVAQRIVLALQARESMHPAIARKVGKHCARLLHVGAAAALKQRNVSIAVMAHDIQMQDIRLQEAIC